VPEFALFLELRHGGHRLLHRHGFVEAVAMVVVDVRGAEAGRAASEAA
jgi:hypothetical protein